MLVMQIVWRALKLASVFAEKKKKDFRKLILPATKFSSGVHNTTPKANKFLLEVFYLQNYISSHISILNKDQGLLMCLVIKIIIKKWKRNKSYNPWKPDTFFFKYISLLSLIILVSEISLNM